MIHQADIYHRIKDFLVSLELRTTQVNGERLTEDSTNSDVRKYTKSFTQKNSGKFSQILMKRFLCYKYINVVSTSPFFFRGIGQIAEKTAQSSLDC